MAGHRVSALARERDEMLRFCRDLSPAQWATPSLADGWTVHDVVAHLGASSRAIFTPTALALLRSDDIERTNDELVERRRGACSADVLAEFAVWSKRVGHLAAAVERTPARRLPMPLGELGLFPTGLVLTGAFTFDLHTHLRFDIAPALGRDAPSSDAERIDVVLAWMLAVLGNTLRRRPEHAPDRPVVLDLLGPGGGRWTVLPDGSVASGATASTRVAGAAADFPSWATHRRPWREHDLTIEGDEEAAARFLDTLRVI